ncbi:hypothetical protein RRG08_035035 [Elysia crispata]|uniref:Uncharacterized protein n=1 Tax=Elysia crispata TaxID=231223 RepID=A0AAE0ZT84_9GAST|nr:hypothetical protein RRG08_035035 [Elysia crispata]
MLWAALPNLAVQGLVCIKFLSLFPEATREKRICGEALVYRSEDFDGCRDLSVGREGDVDVEESVGGGIFCGTGSADQMNISLRCSVYRLRVFPFLSLKGRLGLLVFSKAFL